MPCVMRWPGTIQAGARNDQITGIIDLLPTFCRIAKVPLPENRNLDGKSILPYLFGKEMQGPIRRAHYWPTKRGVACIRYDNWKYYPKGMKPGGQKKLIDGNYPKDWRFPAAPGSLFDLKNDLGETVDVSKQHPEIVQKFDMLIDAFWNDFKNNTREIGRLD